MLFPYRSSSRLLLTTTIGGAVGLFCAVSAILLHLMTSLVVLPNRERLVRLEESDLTDGGSHNVSPYTLDAWRQLPQVFEGVAGFFARGQEVIVDHHGHLRAVQAASVTPEMFDVLGASPVFGRTFSADPAAEILLSESLWRAWFDADKAILGSQLHIEGGLPTTIVGVMPNLDPIFGSTDVWLRLVLPPSNPAMSRQRTLGVIGRLRPAVSVDQAQAALSQAGANLAKSLPDPYLGRRATATPLASYLRQDIQPFVIGVFAFALFILASAVLNALAVLLYDAQALEQNTAIRVALGAARKDIVTLFGINALKWLLIAGFVAAAVAWLSLNAIANAEALHPELWRSLSDGYLISLIAFVVTICMAPLFVLCSLSAAVPRSLATALSQRSRFKVAGRGVGMVQATTVVQLVLAIVMVYYTQAFYRMLRAELSVNQGITKSDLLTISIRLPVFRPGEPNMSAQRFRFSQTVMGLLDELSKTGGVQNIAAAQVFPLSAPSDISMTSVSSTRGTERSDSVTTVVNRVTPGYFQTLGIPIIRGSVWPQPMGPLSSERQTSARRDAVISESLANILWPGTDPLEREVWLGARNYRIIGVASEVALRWPQRDVVPHVYLSFFDEPYDRVTVAVVTDTSQQKTLSSIMSAVEARSRDLAVTGTHTLNELVDRRIGGRQMLVSTASVAALIALLLVAVSVYALSVDLIRRRHHEIAIRMAVGASPAQVRLFASRGPVFIAATSAIVAVFVVIWSSDFAAALIPGMRRPEIPSVIASSGIVVMAVSVVAWVASRKIGRISPLAMLRSV